MPHWYCVCSPFRVPFGIFRGVALEPMEGRSREDSRSLSGALLFARLAQASIWFWPGCSAFLSWPDSSTTSAKGRYSLSDALLYVALTLPGRMIEMAPPSALLGSIIALGLLAKNLELVAIRACGISIQRIGLAVAKPAVLTLLALLLGAQFITPYLEQTAWTRRETALADIGDNLAARRFLDQG